jgi:hypothetical protein
MRGREAGAVALVAGAGEHPGAVRFAEMDGVFEVALLSMSRQTSSVRKGLPVAAKRLSTICSA